MAYPVVEKHQICSTTVLFKLKLLSDLPKSQIKRFALFLTSPAAWSIPVDGLQSTMNPVLVQNYDKVE